LVQNSPGCTKIGGLASIALLLSDAAEVPCFVHYGEELVVKTILVLGGAGAMGQIAAQDLADTATECEIIIGDFNIEKNLQTCGGAVEAKERHRREGEHQRGIQPGRAHEEG
jgi:hypothetical protein